jgi:hypothetical protein
VFVSRLADTTRHRVQIPARTNEKADSRNNHAAQRCEPGNHPLVSAVAHQFSGRSFDATHFAGYGMRGRQENTNGTGFKSRRIKRTHNLIEARSNWKNSVSRGPAYLQIHSKPPRTLAHSSEQDRAVRLDDVQRNRCIMMAKTTAVRDLQ